MFSRPEMKTERVSYDVITPSAARGILESIYWHPGMHYRINQIYVLNPIHFTNVRTNEVAKKILARDIQVMASNGIPSHLFTTNEIEQRASMMLTDVHYVINASIILTGNAEYGELQKYFSILKRRLEKGACYSQPYLGTRECTANVALWPDDKPIPSISETRDLGWMLYDMDYSDSKHIQPMFFHAQMAQGKIDLRDCEVVT